MAFLDWIMRLVGVEVVPAKARHKGAEASGARTGAAAGSSAPQAAHKAAHEAVPQATAHATAKAADTAEPAADTADGVVRVLVAELRNDRQNAFTGRLTQALDQARVVQVRPSPRVPRALGAQTAADLAALQSEAAELLTAERADVLIAGSLSKTTMRLRLVPAEPPPAARLDAFVPSDSLLLPPNFDARHATLAYASVLAAALPSRPAHRATLITHIASAADQCRGLLESAGDDDGHGDDAPPPDHLASQMTHLGVVSGVAWRGSGRPDLLQAAADAYRRAAADGPKEVAPAMLAGLRIRLGLALQEQAAESGDEALLTEAAEAFEKVAAALDANTHGTDWATAQQCLGDLLAKRGHRESNARFCADAVDAFDDALNVFTKEAHRGRWMDLMSLRGGAYLTWGSLEAGARRLQASVDIYRQVLDTRNQDTAPLQWAQAANNLGSAAFALAKRTSDGAMLNEAAGAYDGALAVYQRLGHKRGMEVLRGNLQRVERLRARAAG